MGLQQGMQSLFAWIGFHRHGNLGRVVGHDDGDFFALPWVIHRKHELFINISNPQIVLLVGKGGDQTFFDLNQKFGFDPGNVVAVAKAQLGKKT